MNSVLQIRPRSRLALSKRFLAVKPTSRFRTCDVAGLERGLGLTMRFGLLAAWDQNGAKSIGNRVASAGNDMVSEKIESKVFAGSST